MLLVNYQYKHILNNLYYLIINYLVFFLIISEVYSLVYTNMRNTGNLLKWTQNSNNKSAKGGGGKLID